RNANDGGTVHQPVEYGQDNWFHARIRNRGSTIARHFLVDFTVLPFAGLEFRFPDDFVPAVATAAGFDLAPGDSTVVAARWPADRIPPPGTHACWLAAVFTRFDAPAAGRHVWEHNNLAQKNLTIVDLAPNDWFLVPFVANRFAFESRRVVLEVWRPAGFELMPVAVLQPSGIALDGLPVRRIALPFADTLRYRSERLDCSGGPPIDAGQEFPSQGVVSLSTLRRFQASMEVAFEPGRRAKVRLRPSAGQMALGLGIGVPADATPGSTIRLNLVRRAEGRERILGGLAVEVRVTKDRSNRTLADGIAEVVRGPLPR
ncbi:MAG TPA: hypothetical protein VFY84_07450, partial [Jiangellales bacterium]|nr:hypothetical protein [Jiangellales bacterium]